MEYSKSIIQLQAVAEDEKLSREHIRHLEQIFDNLPEVYFCVKGITGHWVGCNILGARLAKFSRRDDVIGAREEDFFPKAIAEQIYDDDMRLLKSGQPLLNRIELIVEEKKHSLVWVTTTKLPILNSIGKVIGLVGITRILPDDNALPGPFEIFRAVVDYIQDNLHSTIPVVKLAELTRLSHSQFRKRFRSQFGISAQEFILRSRLQAASHLLMTSDLSIGEITYRCGFTDQSYFTRQFKKFFAETPLRHRQRWLS